MSPAEELAQARAQLQVMEGRLTDAHPDVRRLRRRVAQLEAQVQVRRRRPRHPGPASPPRRAAARQTAAELLRERRIRDTRAELDAINRRILALQKDQQRLQQETSLYQARLEAAPIRESEQIELMRDYETVQELYRRLLAKHEESKIAANHGEPARSASSSACSIPRSFRERPFSPDRAQAERLGIVLGLLIGLGIVAALEFTDSTLKSEEDIRTVLALPVIATIPIFAPKPNRPSRRRLRGLLTGSGAGSWSSPPQLSGAYADDYRADTVTRRESRSPRSAPPDGPRSGSERRRQAPRRQDRAVGGGASRQRRAVPASRRHAPSRAGADRA